MKKRRGAKRQIRPRAARRSDLGLSAQEFAVFRPLSSPRKIQGYVNRLNCNFELHGDTCLTVREVLRRRHVHCIEAALFAACALWIHGEPPLLLDLKAVHDFDHVVALFRRRGCWGAISRSNHVTLRYRDPVYRTLRELAMSYFHEYLNKKGRPSLRSYSRAFDLRRLDAKSWVSREGNCWDVAATLDETRHYPLIAPRQARDLRSWDPIERKAAKLVDERAPRKRRH